MIVVTGGAGFIGSNVVRALNARGEFDVVVVDDLRDGTKYRNLLDCDIADYRDAATFRAELERGGPAAAPRAVIHQGACSDTTEWDGRYMLDNNYEYSRLLLEYCRARSVPLVYASSAAVYGREAVSRETPEHERPLNVYGYSKLLFDRYVRRRLGTPGPQVVGLRYFNVYGPGEGHKKRMASVAWQLHGQRGRGEMLKLFEGSDGYGPGEQRRDFVHVDDVVQVVLWFLDHPDRCGIFNVGTGKAESFNAVANAVIAWHGGGEIQYIPFPDDLRGRYQSFTEADLAALRGAGYDGRFMTVAEGVPRYLDELQRRER